MPSLAQVDGNIRCAFEKRACSVGVALDQDACARECCSIPRGDDLTLPTLERLEPARFKDLESVIHTVFINKKVQVGEHQVVPLEHRALVLFDGTQSLCRGHPTEHR